MYAHEVPVRERTEAVLICVCERGREAGEGGEATCRGVPLLELSFEEEDALSVVYSCPLLCVCPPPTTLVG